MITADQIDTSTRDGCLVAADLAEEQGRPDSARYWRDRAAYFDRQAAADEHRKWLRRIQRRVRTAAGAQGTRCPIQIVDGFAEPEWKGEKGYHTTPNGTVCQYPSAYRRAHGRTTYHPSTERVEVGAGWLIENGLA